jgi:hypothetical protein
VIADGEPLEMHPRAEPGPIFPNSDVPGGEDFPVRVCEVTPPPGKSQVLLDGKALPLPRADIRRRVFLRPKIAVFVAAQLVN